MIQSAMGICPKHLEKFKFQKGQKAWNYNKVELNCIVCGNPFLVPPAHSHKRKTCSLKCHWETKKKLPIDGVKQCNTCHQIFPATHKYFFNDIRTSCGLSRNCKKCHTIRSHSWNYKNIDRVRTRQRNYQRQHRIGNNGHDIRQPKGKREYPIDELCEICREKGRLIYHHWDNSNFSKGIWICHKCHFASHWLEKYDPNLFFDLKIKINLLSNNEVF